MVEIIPVACLVLYLLCSLWFLLGSLLQLHLMFKSGIFSFNRKMTRRPKLLKEEEKPVITIQVPVFNERFVIGRLLAALENLDYPKSHFEIQILDDSTDETSILIERHAQQLKSKGIDVSILRRKKRTGFKAGALQAGLIAARGSLIAIFDADFEPSGDFLKKASIHFSDPKVGGVQGRWGHRNLDDSWLTVIQTYLLDCHFSLEQQGRSNAGYYMNFNGTAGIWRKSCIEDVGGWNGTVLTEDLELSYRAQLNGWKFIYDEQVTVPADLPADMESFKTQQFRWAKGLAQSARCHLKNVLSAEISFAKKLHAVFHLLSSMSFLAVFGNFVFALPIIIGRHQLPAFKDYSEIIVITGITLPILITYYSAGTRANLSRSQFWKYLPAFLIVYMALSVQNTIAVLQGIFGIHSPFVRTPKPGNNLVTYRESSKRWSWINSFELMTLLYIVSAIVLSVIWADYFLITFLLMGAAGLFLIIKPLIKNNQLAPVIKMPARRNHR